MLLFTLVLLVHGLSPVSQSCDSMWSVLLGLSTMREGYDDFDECRDAVMGTGSAS